MFHENTLALGAFLLNLSSKAVVTSKYSLSVSCVNRVSNHNGMSHSMNMYRTTWVKWTEHQRSSEPTWGAPPPSCVASCPSAPPAARAPPRCPSVRTDLTSGPSLTRLQLSSTPSDQTISSFWSSIADKKKKYINHKIPHIRAGNDRNKTPELQESDNWVHFILQLFLSLFVSSTFWQKKNKNTNTDY